MFIHLLNLKNINIFMLLFFSSINVIPYIYLQVFMVQDSFLYQNMIFLKYWKIYYLLKEFT